MWEKILPCQYVRCIVIYIILSVIIWFLQVLRGRSFSSASAPKVTTALGTDGGSSTASHQNVIRTTSDSAKVVPEIPRVSQAAAVARKRSSSSLSREVSTAEEFFLDVILQRHAKVRAHKFVNAFCFTVRITVE